jgi:hypothetical protein
MQEASVWLGRSEAAEKSIQLAKDAVRQPDDPRSIPKTKKPAALRLV